MARRIPPRAHHLREQLAKADQREESERRRAERAEHELALTNNSLVSERDRAEEMERHVNELMAERRQTHASPPDVRSVIKEVIREIAGAAPPDDRDDRETLRRAPDTADGGAPLD